MESLGVCYWYVTMPQCGCVEPGLASITFYVKKNIAHLVALFWFPAGSRRVARGSPIAEGFLYHRRISRFALGIGYHQYLIDAECLSLV